MLLLIALNCDHFSLFDIKNELLNTSGVHIYLPKNVDTHPYIVIMSQKCSLTGKLTLKARKFLLKSLLDLRCSDFCSMLYLCCFRGVCQRDCIPPT